jgi:hypothetical protein
MAQTTTGAIHPLQNADHVTRRCPDFTLLYSSLSQTKVAGGVVVLAESLQVEVVVTKV